MVDETLLAVAQNPEPSEPSQPLLLGLPQLAVLLSRSVSALERDHARGLLPRPIKLGGSRKWRRAEIEAWVNAGCPSQDRWDAAQSS